MNRYFSLQLAVALAVALSFVPRADATLIVPMDAESLAASSELVAAGTIQGVTHAALDDGRIVRRVEMTVEETWKGSAGGILELVERGGIVGDRGEIVHGAPAYQRGEPVIVFAARTPLGWQTNHMLQGKFRIERDGEDKLWAVREVGPGVAVLADRTADWQSSLPLDELRAAVGGYAPAPGTTAPWLDAALASRQVWSEFTTQRDNPRFFEADLEVPLVFLVDDRGDSILGLEASRRAVDDAFAAWNAVSDTGLDLRDGGLSDDRRAEVPPGVHRVLFDDPFDEMFDPTDCKGTLGIGGSIFTMSEQKTFGGRTYNRILNARITFADNWDGCEEWTECNFSEVAGHEGGHAFGLGHSSEKPLEPDSTLRDALMYFQAHFDGRCADPRDDDRDGLRAVYPAAAPPSIATESPLPPGVMLQPYRVELEAADATPPLTWASIGEGCPDVADLTGLELGADGVISGTVPNITGDVVELCFTIELTDADGERHSKRLDVTFIRAANVDTPTPTAIPTSPAIATSTPLPSTPTATIPAIRPCVGDCNGDGQLNINELIRGVNIALGNAALDSCPSFDRDGNGRVAINELVAAVTAALSGCTG